MIHPPCTVCGNKEYTEVWVPNCHQYACKKETPEILKRVLSAMQIGVFIQAADGHRYIRVTDWDINDGPSLNEQLAHFGLPSIQGKCYGNLGEALDAIDQALKNLSRPSLLSDFKEEMWQ